MLAKKKKIQTCKGEQTNKPTYLTNQQPANQPTQLVIKFGQQLSKYLLLWIRRDNEWMLLNEWANHFKT